MPNVTQDVQILAVASPRSLRYNQPAARTIAQLIESRAATTPQSVVLCAPDKRPLTYEDLAALVGRSVERLRAAGISQSDRVALVLPNGPDMATGFLSVAAAATCAPLNPSYRASEFDFYLSDLNAKALVIASGMASPAREIAAARGIPVVELKSDVGARAGEFALDGQFGEPVAFSTATPSDIALVLHTSGTTSRPKIVPLSHSNVCHSAHNVATTLALTDQDRCLNVMPLFHIHGLIAALLGSLTAGGSVICSPGFDGAHFFTWVDAFQPTWYTAVPTVHQAVLRAAGQHPDIVARRRFRFIRSSSASLPPALLHELESTFSAPVIEAYGMTEAAHQMASNPLPPLTRKPGSVGVSAGPEVAVMDSDGNLLPPGSVGEVVIRGPNVTGGYENNPDANAKAFTNTWFRTGDQGSIDADGYLTLTGRLKEIINRGGEKIAPREIDEVLTEHPAVALAVAFATPHQTLGEDVAAAVVLKPGASVQEDELLKFASERLAEFKVPKQLLIVEEIPKGPTGKLQRIGLAEKLEPLLAAKRASKFQAAATPLETQLQQIWTNVLKVGNIGVRDSFFELGGDSLAFMTMLLEVERSLGISVPVDAFLSAPTIQTISELSRGGPSSDAPTPSQSHPATVRDSVFKGLKNRVFQLVALYSPGFRTTRVWLHRMRGVSIGNNVSIGLSALIETAYPELVQIGNNVSIGMRTTIIGHLRDSTVHARRLGQRTVHIEDGAYIGPGVIILPNVRIGKGAVVSAGSVVSRSVPPQTLVRGNPAVPIARCGVSLGGGVSYEEFVRNLRPLPGDEHRSTTKFVNQPAS